MSWSIKPAKNSVKAKKSVITENSESFKKSFVVNFSIFLKNSDDTFYNLDRLLTKAVHNFHNEAQGI